MTSRNKSIDGLRGFAALYVLCFHQFEDLRILPGFLHNFILMGAQAVPLFFMVSGFLLFPRLKRESTNNPRWRSDFYIRRAFRILPLWWLLLLASSLVWRISGRVLVANLTLIFGFVSFNPDYLPIIPAWSLFVEEWFYIGLPFLSRFLRNGFQITLMLIAALFLSQFWVDAAPRLGIPTSNDFVYRFPFAHLQYFLFGILLAHGFENEWFREVVLKQIRGRIAFILSVLAIVCFFSPAYKVWVPIWIGSGLIFFSALAKETFLSKAFSWRPICWVGERCYFIYIAQTPITGLFWPVRHHLAQRFHLGYDKSTLYIFPVLLGTLFITAELSWRYWERPWQKLGSRLTHFVRSGNQMNSSRSLSPPNI